MKIFFIICSLVLFSASAYAQTSLKQELEALSFDPFYDEFYDINGDPTKEEERERIRREKAENKIEDNRNIINLERHLNYNVDYSEAESND